jgi:hypothetical protein
VPEEESGAGMTFLGAGVEGIFSGSGILGRRVGKKKNQVVGVEEVRFSRGWRRLFDWRFKGMEEFYRR